MYLRWAERHRFHDRDHRPAGGRAGRPQERHRRDPWSARLRLAAGRARRPPARAHQPVRLAEAAPDDVRPASRSCPRSTTTSRSSSTGTHPGRHLSHPGRRRPARQQDRQRGPPHPRPDRHRRPEPERAVADAEQGERDQGPQGAPPGAGPRGEGGGAPRAQGRARRGRLGQPDPELRAAPVPDGQGPAHRATRPATRRAVLDGDLDAFMQAELERLATGGAVRGEDVEAARLVTTRLGDGRGTGADATARRPPTSSRPAPTSGASSINDYVARLGQPDAARARSRRCSRLYAPPPGDRPGALRRRRSTASGSSASPAAVMRERLWFLSMLLRPARSAGRAASGASCSRPGRARRRTPDVVRATATDSAPADLQRACTPRAGSCRASRCSTSSGLPTRSDGVRRPAVRRPAGRRSRTSPADPAGDGHRRLADAIDALDRELLGVAHPIDHRFLRRRVGGAACINGPDGAPIGYGYARRAGRVGPIAVRDADLLAPSSATLTGHGPGARRVRAVAARECRRRHRRARSAPGLRLDEFPLLLCWDRPFAGLRRATCRSPPDCSRRHRTGPSSGVPWSRWSRLPVRGAGGSLGCDVAPRTVPADGVESTRDRRMATVIAVRPAAESNVTIAPRPHRGAIAPAPHPGAWPDQAVQERAVLVLHDVTKQYPNGKVALRDVDLVIPEGDFVFLVGPSGAGKSTLIKLLIRDEVATRGAGRPRRPGPRPTAASPGAEDAPQDRDHLPGLQAAPDQDGLGERRVRARGHRPSAQAHPAGGRPRAGDRRADRPGAADADRSCPAASSSAPPSPGPSSTTRASIIADEPTGNLDPLISWEILQLLLRINELGVTVLMATHNAEVVTSLRTPRRRARGGPDHPRRGRWRLPPRGLTGVVAVPVLQRQAGPPGVLAERAS